MPDLYAQLHPKETEKVKAVSIQKTQDWGQEAGGGGMTCGHFVVIGGGTGSGTGSLFMQPLMVGPFLEQ